MQGNSNPITVLIADDDPEDRMLIEDAFEESRLANPLEFVEDGEELLDYLHRRNGYSDPSASPRPGLILLDLNMPRRDGREALKEIKSDPHLRQMASTGTTPMRAQASGWPSATKLPSATAEPSPRRARRVRAPRLPSP